MKKRKENPEPGTRNQELKYATFMDRLMACCIDSTLLFILLLPMIAFFNQHYYSEEENRFIEELREAGAGGGDFKSKVDNFTERFSEGIASDREMLARQIDKFTTESIVQVLVAFPILVFFWVRRGATPGKMVFSMKVVDGITGDPPGIWQSFIRFIGYFVSALPLLLGFIWMKFDRKNRCFHDLMADTVVVYSDEQWWVLALKKIRKFLTNSKD